MTQLIEIAAARPSKSGKTLSVQSKGGRWLQCKDFTLQNLIGRTIETTVSEQNFPDGGSILWINDYHLMDGGRPAPQAYAPSGHETMPVAARPDPIHAPASPVDLQASIVAQCLCKTLENANVGQAWRSYKELYARYVAWSNNNCLDPTENEQFQQEMDTAVQQEFNDEIPF